MWMFFSHKMMLEDVPNRHGFQYMMNEENDFDDTHKIYQGCSSFDTSSNEKLMWSWRFDFAVLSWSIYSIKSSDWSVHGDIRPEIPVIIFKFLWFFWRWRERLDFVYVIFFILKLDRTFWGDVRTTDMDMIVLSIQCYIVFPIHYDSSSKIRLQYS